MYSCLDILSRNVRICDPMSDELVMTFDASSIDFDDDQRAFSSSQRFVAFLSNEGKDSKFDLVDLEKKEHWTIELPVYERRTAFSVKILYDRYLVASPLGTMLPILVWTNLRTRSKMTWMDIK